MVISRYVGGSLAITGFWPNVLSTSDAALMKKKCSFGLLFSCIALLSEWLNIRLVCKCLAIALAVGHWPDKHGNLYKDQEVNFFESLTCLYSRGNSVLWVPGSSFAPTNWFWTISCTYRKRGRWLLCEDKRIFKGHKVHFRNHSSCQPLWCLSYNSRHQRPYLLLSGTTTMKLLVFPAVYKLNNVITLTWV